MRGAVAGGDDPVFLLELSPLVVRDKDDDDDGAGGGRHLDPEPFKSNTWSNTNPLQ